MITTRTRFVAAACALGLAAAGLSACSDASDKAKDTAASAQAELDKAGEAAVDGAKKANEGASKAAADAKAAASEAADAAKDAASKAGDAAMDAGDAAKDAASKAGDAAKDGASKAATAASEAATAASSAASEAADAAMDAMADAKKAATATDKDVSEGDMVEVTDVNGATVEVPAPINVEATKLGASTLGKLVNVKNSGGKWVASYANGWHIAYSKATGAQPVKGKIGQVWFDNGNITNPVGMPTAPEQTKPNNEGWDQQFTGGEIWAGMDGTSGTVTK